MQSSTINAPAFKHAGDRRCKTAQRAPLGAGARAPRSELYGRAMRDTQVVEVSNKQSSLRPNIVKDDNRRDSRETSALKVRRLLSARDEPDEVDGLR